MNTISHIVNLSLRSPDRTTDSLRPVLPFLKLLLTALRNLPQSFHFKGTVFGGEAGCHPHFATTFKTGQCVTYYGFTSTTLEANALSEEVFCGTHGLRTALQIEGIIEGAYKIASLSAFPAHNEVLLEPGFTIRVKQAIKCDEFPLITHLAAGTTGLHFVVGEQVV